MFLLILLIFLASCGLTGMLRHYALRQGLIDNPNERSSHTVPTPRGGGLAFVITFLSALGLAYFFNPGLAPKPEPFWALLFCGLLIAGIGFWDDHVHIPARWRFLVHSIAALAGLILLGVPEIPLPGMAIDPGIIGYPLGVLALVWLLNLFNFMDGIDGIAGTEALFTGIGAMLIMSFGAAGNYATPLLWLSILMAGVGGFLIWNWPPAKIFMGDAGSGFLGLMLGLFALWCAGLGLSPWVWVILLALFVTDATVTLIRRMLRGERWFEAHRSHLYQRLARRWGGHRPVTLALLGINCIWLLPLAWWAAIQPQNGLFAALTAYLPLVFVAIRSGAGRADGETGS